MKKLMTLLLVGAVLAPFQANAADTGPVAEIFACSFNEGKNWDDFLEVNAFFGEQLRKIGGAADDFNAYVWRPFRGSVDFDYLWAGYYDNLGALADSWQVYGGTEEGAAADARWDELETCRSALTTVEQIYDAEGIPSGDSDTAVIESFRCNLQPGKSLADVRSVIEVWHEHVSAVDKPFDVYMRTPIVSGSDIDHSYFVVHESFAAYGDNISAYNTHPDTAGIDAMLDEVQDCTNALWRSQRAFVRDE